MDRKELLSKCGLPETWRFDVSLDRVGRWREDSSNSGYLSVCVCACVRDLPELSMNLWLLACREGSGTGRQSALLLLGREPDVEHIRPATARAQVFVCACSATLNVLQLLASALSLVLCLAAFFCFLSSRRHASNLTDSM